MSRIVRCATAICGACLLTLTAHPVQGVTVLPAIQGQVLDRAAPVSGAELQLYIDNGDAILDGNDTMAGATTTDALGQYFFEDLDPDQSYFVLHDGKVSQIQSPGAIGSIIDSFDSVQAVEANPVSGAVTHSIEDNGILGNVRDLYLEVLSGTADAKLRSNPFALTDNLQIDMSAGVTGTAVVTWDGISGAGGLEPDLGLSASDLTQGGLFDGISLRLAVDAAGAGQQLKLLLYSGDQVSTATLDFPVDRNVEPTLMSFAPFSSFVGGADPTRVDAVQLIVENARPSLDARIDMIGLSGPARVDFALTPEPASGILIMLGTFLVLARRRRVG